MNNLVCYLLYIQKNLETFYKDNKLDIANRLGDADYLNQPRILHRRANVVSIPSGLFGTKIKPGTFQMTGSGWNIVDDNLNNKMRKFSRPFLMDVFVHRKISHLNKTTIYLINLCIHLDIHMSFAQPPS